MKRRVVGIIVRDRKILLIRRIKDGKEYFVFPGGGAEEGETLEDAVIRELNEELGLDIKIDKLLTTFENQGREEFYFLVTKFSGTPKIGGEELERMDDRNQYHLLWMEVEKLKNFADLYPRKAREEIAELLARDAQIEAILFRRGKSGGILYLLLKRTEKRGGFWQPVTGGINFQESPMEALRREIKEELGIFMPIAIIDISYTFSFKDAYGRSLTEYVYGAEINEKQEIRLSAEHTEYRWVGYEEARTLLKWEGNKIGLARLHSILTREL